MYYIFNNVKVCINVDMTNIADEKILNFLHRATYLYMKAVCRN